MQISLWTGQIHHSDGLDQTVDSFTNQTRCPSTWPIIFPRDQLYPTWPTIFPRDQLSFHGTPKLPGIQRYSALANYPLIDGIRAGAGLGWIF